MPVVIALAWIGRFFTALAGGEKDPNQKKKPLGEKAFSLGVYVFILFPLGLLLGAVALSVGTLVVFQYGIVPLIG